MTRSAVMMALGALAWGGTVLLAQRTDVFVESRDHRRIAYSTAATANRIDAVNRRIRDGAVTLRFEPVRGYLRSVLEALSVPVESQTLVFSPTSFQAPLITMRNPRALYFNDAVSVGWVRGSDLLELAVHDPRQGVIFYELRQEPTAMPQFRRNDECLTCHLSWDALGVPGLLALSTAPRLTENSYANGFVTDHRSPLRERWGGWYVTGAYGGTGHMGNVPVSPAERGKGTVPMPNRELKSVEGLFDLKGFLTPHSDVVALYLLGHQVRATNLITRLGWEARVAEGAGETALARVREAAHELVDYLLFVDEIPLAKVRGYSGFTEAFSAQGPRDSRGRSLRQLDLQRRLMTYPGSYMIYSEAFDALPATARDAVYARMWEILSGKERAPRYRSLSVADRRAVVEILRETRSGLPTVFAGPIT